MHIMKNVKIKNIINEDNGCIIEIVNIIIEIISLKQLELPTGISNLKNS